MFLKHALSWRLTVNPTIAATRLFEMNAATNI